MFDPMKEKIDGLARTAAGRMRIELRPQVVDPSDLIEILRDLHARNLKLQQQIDQLSRRRTWWQRLFG